MLVAVAAFVAVRLLVLLTLFVAADREGQSAYRLLTKWDAQWYAAIADDGYGFVRVHEDGRLLSDYVFFPLFPVTERIVAGATGLSAASAGLLISAVASVVAAVGVFAVAERVLDARTGVIAVVLWAVVPVGIVESMAYSEAVFTALAAWALYAVLTQRWLLAALLACAAGLTRPTGVAVVAAVVVAAAVGWARSRREEQRSRLLDSRLAAVAIAPLGLIGYLAWVGLERGTPAGYFRAAAGWENGFDGGVNFVRWVGRLVGGPQPWAGVLVVVGVLLLVGLLVLSVRQGQPLPLLVFTTTLVVLTLTTSGYFGSKPRYLLPAFPLLFPVAQWLAGRSTVLRAGALTAAALAAAGYGAVWLLGPGPP